MNMVGILDRISQQVFKSYFSAFAYDYQQDQIHETKSRLFRMSNQVVSVAEGLDGLNINGSQMTSKKDKFKHRGSVMLPVKNQMKNILTAMAQKFEVDSLQSDKRESMMVSQTQNLLKEDVGDSPILSTYHHPTDVALPVVSPKKYSFNLDKNFDSNSSEEIEEDSKSRFFRKQNHPGESTKPLDPFTLKHIATIESKEKRGDDKDFRGLDMSQLSSVSQLAELQNVLGKVKSSDPKAPSKRNINIFDMDPTELKTIKSAPFSSSDLNEILHDGIKTPGFVPSTKNESEKSFQDSKDKKKRKAAMSIGTHVRMRRTAMMAPRNMKAAGMNVGNANPETTAFS